MKNETLALREVTETVGEINRHCVGCNQRYTIRVPLTHPCIGSMRHQLGIDASRTIVSDVDRLEAALNIAIDALGYYANRDGDSKLASDSLTAVLWATPDLSYRHPDGQTLHQIVASHRHEHDDRCLCRTCLEREEKATLAREEDRA